MINILVVTHQQNTGLNYHRQLIPHSHLDREYPNEYRCDITYNITTFSEQELSSYSIVTFLRIVDYKGNTVEIINRCKRAGCKVIIDIDDYWILHKDHELKDEYIKHNYAAQALDGLRNADYVTTTTEIFATKIREINKNVVVLPNSIDTTEPQFEQVDYYSDRMRFGWVGGLYHIQDVRLMYEGICELWKTDNTKFQLCLGGYSDNYQYHFLEKIFTDNYKNLNDNKYLKYLKLNKQEGNEAGDTQPYKRLWGSDVWNYAKLYNEIDIALIPLNVNGFNQYKSQLKIIEAGWFKKSVIVSNVPPYSIDCTKNNSMLINPSKRNEGWGVAMKSLVLNPNKANDQKEKLHELVKEKYIMDVVNKDRHEFYQSI